MKHCTKCNTSKPREAFAKHSRTKDGLQTACKACNKTYREANRAAIREQKAGRYAATREAVREQQAAYRAANPGLLAAVTAKRTCGRAVPPWLTDDHLETLLETYAQAAEADAQVDHIVPRMHPLVSGLHVPWNTQVLEPTLNKRKQNYLPLVPEYSFIHEHDGKAFDPSAGETVEVAGGCR